jgi:DUF4097 and DUF4098 domain-containing protein YvlB
MQPPIVVALPLAVLFLSGCGDMDFDILDRFREDFRQEHSLAPGGTVALEGFNGSIEIRSWEKDAVEINGTKYATSSERLKQIRIDIDAQKDRITIRADRPAARRGGAGVRFVLRVPRRVELSDIRTSNGSIRVEDIEGTARLRTSNGSLRLARIRGNVRAETSNASIELRDLAGAVYARTSNGGIRGEVVRGSFEGVTSNSSIEIRLREMDANQPVRLESSNGRIDVTLDAVREVRASTSNASIQVRLPAGANANVRAQTSNSSIQTDFDVVASGRLSRTALEGRIGSGGPLIDLSTSNGSIRITRQ